MSNRQLIRARNKAEMLQQAIFQVLPAARATRTFRLADGDRLEATAESSGDDRVVYGAYDPQGQLVGVAVETSGLGYPVSLRRKQRSRRSLTFIASAG